MMMCHLTAKTNCGGWIANRTKLQGVKSSFRTLGCKIQLTPNFRCNVPVKVKKKKRKEKKKRGIRLNGHTCPTYPFVPHHTPHPQISLLSSAGHLPSLICFVLFFFFFFLTNTHSSLHSLTLPRYPLHTITSTIIFPARITGKLFRNL